VLIPFVAHAGVLAEVDSALTAVRAGRGALLMVTGEDYSTHRPHVERAIAQVATWRDAASSSATAA
jgi:hypothetical protein